MLRSKRIICRLLQDRSSVAAHSCAALVHALWLMLCCSPECIFNGLKSACSPLLPLFPSAEGGAG